MGSEPTIFLIACLVSLALTALIREVAPRIGLTDNPDGYRKLHGRATPLGGGVAVYLTSAIILGTLWVAPSDLSTPEPEGNADTTISAPAESTSEGNGGTTSSASAESTSDGHAGDIASTSAESTSADDGDTASSAPADAVFVFGPLWVARAEPDQAPTIGSLSADPDPVTQGVNLTLTANSVADSNGTVSKVEFYRDVNGNGSIDVGTDALLGTDTSSSGGWTWTGSTSGFPLGGNTYMARAQGDDSAWSNTVTAPPKEKSVQEKLRLGYPDLPWLLLAGLVIVILGLVDDVRNLSGKQKLLGQIVAASILLAGGLLIERVECFGWLVGFGWLAYPITLFWFLGAINSLNLLDGIDGLAAMLGIILSCTIAAMSVLTGNYGVAIVAMVFAGSLLGFMRYNFPPASIFLGDTGSMLIGLVVGALAIRGSLKGAGTVLLAAPLAVWTIPIFDSVAAILRRKLTGQSIYATDRGHLHHRLLNLLGSNRKVLGWVAACCAVISVATLAGLIRRDDRITLLTCFAVVAIFVATGAFGRVELLLVGAGLRRVGRMLVAPIISRQPTAWQTSIQLQGMHQWELLWSAFVESADKLRLTEIRLDVHVPTMHEAYHASWERPRRSKNDRCWRVEIPLVINDCPIGRVRISGQRNGQSACLDIQQLMELIEPFEARIQSLAGQPVRGVAGDEAVLDRPDMAGQPKSTCSGTTPK